jgi:nucleotide-binding universal stress UspA family protein
MKILHAVESATLAENAVRLVSALRFTAPQISLVHVVQRLEPLVSKQPITGQSDFITSFFKLQEDSAKESLAEVAGLYSSEGIAAESRLITGFTSKSLLAEARQSKTDLLVVASRRRSGVERFTTESICMSLLHKAPQSVLIAREVPPAKESISAVLATDHSEYCNNAVRQLKGFAPQGIKQLLIVSCLPAPLCQALEAAPREAARQSAEQATADLAQQNENLAAELSGLGANVKTMVLAKPPLEAIPEVMKTTGANLLILGAHGHGFFDRIALGSVSHTLVTKLSCSVMVLRSAGQAD